MISQGDEEFLKDFRNYMDRLEIEGVQSGTRGKRLLGIVEQLKEEVRYLTEQNFGQHLLVNSIERLEKERDALREELRKYEKNSISKD